MVSSNHSKVRSSQNMDFSITSPCLGKGISFSNNSDLINLVDLKLLHENGKQIICVSDGIFYILIEVTVSPIAFVTE